jgi:membrane protein
MNTPQDMLRAVDRLQRRRPALAFVVAVLKKFSDDQAGNLAALLAYYAFLAILPLLLVLVTVLDIVLSHDPGLRAKVLDSALRYYPVLRTQLVGSVHSLNRSGLALVVGLIASFLGARGVARVAQNAFNAVWEVPFERRPQFPWSLLRGLGLILAVGLGQIITGILSGFAGGVGHAITRAGPEVGAAVLSLVLNVGLFWLAFRLATASEVSWRDLRLGAMLAAVSWQVLQLVGGYVLDHLLHHSSALYGVFGVVLGLLVWLYLQARITLYAIEASTVNAWRLWPRGLLPPLTEQDQRAYKLYAQATRRSAAD